MTHGQESGPSLLSDSGNLRVITTILWLSQPPIASSRVLTVTGQVPSVLQSAIPHIRQQLSKAASGPNANDLFHHSVDFLVGYCFSVHGTPLLLLSLQFCLRSSSTLACIPTFPLHFLVSDSARPHSMFCLLPHRPVGQSWHWTAPILDSESFSSAFW